MKTALVTTTINVPHVLKLYRQHGPDVAFFVAADEKTPREAYEFCADIENCEIYSPDRQRELNYSCSELIGWSTIGRRNIMVLEALKWGADVIVTIDDDNIPILTARGIEDYFTLFTHHWISSQHWENVPDSNTALKLIIESGYREFNGLRASSVQGWYDPGDLLVPKTKHRGFPIQVKPEAIYEPVTDVRIGVAQGLCLGDPDIDAVTRIATAPNIHSVSELGRAGVVTDPKGPEIPTVMSLATRASGAALNRAPTWSVFNTQNTAYLRELAPAMFCAPGLGRFDDIFASLICQRVMREKNLHVHYGQPFVWQQRNQHDLIKDLRVEIDGMANIMKLAEILNTAPVEGPTATAMVANIYNWLTLEDWWPAIATKAGLAWIDDIEKVL